METSEWSRFGGRLCHAQRTNRSREGVVIGRVLLLAGALVCAVLAVFPFWVEGVSRKERRARQGPIGFSESAEYFAGRVFWGVFFTFLAVYLALGAFGIWFPVG